MSFASSPNAVPSGSRVRLVRHPVSGQLDDFPLDQWLWFPSLMLCPRAAPSCVMSPDLWGLQKNFFEPPPALPGVEGRVLCLGLFPPPIFQGKLPGYSGLVARVYPLSHLDCFLLIFSILKDLTCIAPAVLKLIEIRLPRLPSVFFFLKYACMPVHHVFVVAAEARRGRQSAGHWSYHVGAGNRTCVLCSSRYAGTHYVT